MSRSSTWSARRSRRGRAALELLLLCLVALLLVACSGGDGSSRPAGPSTLASGTGSPALTESAAASGLTGLLGAQPPSDWHGPLIGVEALPPEARETLTLISAGGPYPYEQDGSTFQNRERSLPDRPPGSYREFTVETPGSPDRGARRLVVGDRGEVYYTADHYDSFGFVTP